MKETFPQLDSSHLAKPASYFISDLHLSDETPQINTAFYAFLEQVAPHADAIYILGDFLDAWVGDDTPAEFFADLEQACQQAAKHTSLYFLRGNRDFLFSNPLLARCHIKRLRDPDSINLYGKTIAVCHGDHLCGKDYAHLILRAVSKSPFFRFIFLSIPLKLRLKIAGTLRSENTQLIIPPYLAKYDVTDPRVRKTLKQAQSDVLIHGHVHRPATYQHTLKSGKTATRYVMGCWGKSGGVILRYGADHTVELLKWDPQSN